MFPIKSIPKPIIREKMAAANLDSIHVKTAKNTMGVRINEIINGENTIKYFFQNDFILVR